jgi:hypothetical protein
MAGASSETSQNLNGPDQVALGAGRVYWTVLVLTDDENAAATLTRKAAALLTPRNQFFNPRFEKWISRIAIKASVALLRAKLVADQRESNAWEEATHALQLEPLEIVNNLSLVSIERAIRSLPVLPRFMFVMRTLNRYSVQEITEMINLPIITCEAAERFALVSLTKIFQLSDLTSWVTTHRFA